MFGELADTCLGRGPATEFSGHGKNTQGRKSITDTNAVVGRCRMSLRTKQFGGKEGGGGTRGGWRAGTVPIMGHSQAMRRSVGCI